MTLARVSGYTPNRFPERGGQAVVIGASIAGLLASRVLVDRFDRVILIEKDELPNTATPRQGTPQARHIHVLHRAGQVVIEDFLPGYGSDLLNAGAVEVDMASDFEVYQSGDFIAHGPSEIIQFSASRPMFEYVARKHVTAFDGIRLREKCHFVEYTTDEHDTVTGVRYREDGSESVLSADLVVDATGRTSRTPRWLESQGYDAPEVEEVSIDLQYATVEVARPPGDASTLLVLPDAPRKRGAAVFPVEHDRWLLTLAGMHGDHPPPDLEGFRAFAASLPIPDVNSRLEDDPLGNIREYPYPSSIRRRYQAVDQFPRGLVVMGDAIASFNPIYGQGMSVAALQALALHRSLVSSRSPEVAHDFFPRAARIIDDAWAIAVGSDFQFGETSGPKPRGTSITNRYVSRLVRKSHTDGKLADAFNRVVIMEKPPSSLFHPHIMWRVFTPF